MARRHWRNTIGRMGAAAWLAVAAAGGAGAAAASTPDSAAAFQSWLLALRLVDPLIPGAPLPLANVFVLLHARLQSCRPTWPADPHLLPPSLRSPPSDDAATSLSPRPPLRPYAQLECVHVWAENWLQYSNAMGIVGLDLKVPVGRLEAPSLLQRSLMGASTRRAQLKLLQQCPAYTPSDEIWMDMVRPELQDQQQQQLEQEEREAARARGELEWDPQGLVALLINAPHMRGFKQHLETRQVLWPFRTEEEVHELDLALRPRVSEDELELELPPQRHPFLPPPSLVSSELSLLDRMRNHVDAMSHWWHMLWLLPLSVLAALGLLRLVVPWVRSSSAMRRVVKACMDLGQLVQDGLEVFARAWKCQRTNVNWEVELNDLRESTRWQLQQLGLACRERAIRPAFDRFEQHLRPLLRSVLQQATLLCVEAALARHRLSSWLRSVLFERVLPAWEAPESQLDRASASYLFPILDSVGETLSHLQGSGVKVVEAAKAHGSVCVRRVDQLTLQLLEVLSNVSRTVAAAFFDSISPSPPAPAPFHYSPSPAPLIRSPSRARSRLRVQADELEGEGQQQSAEQRLRELPRAQLVDLEPQPELPIEFEAEIGFGTPHQRHSAQVWSKEAGEERFQQLLKIDRDAEESKQPQSQLIGAQEKRQEGEHKQRAEASTSLHMRVWREAEEKQASRPRMQPLAYMIVRSPAQGL